MVVEDFDYDLPEELIRQTPLLKRDESKLLILDRDTSKIEHKHFYDIVDYLDENDVLVLNDTRVIPARIIGIKEETNAVIELLILKNIEGNYFECLAKPAKRFKKDTIINFGDNLLKAKCLEEKEDGIRIVEFIYDGILLELLEKLGTMPLPPYITEKLKDQDRYQTIYAKNNGSSAAPTAGLHFTEELFNKLKAKNVEILYVTLHIGLGTFRPVTTSKIEEHNMHTEYYEMDNKTAERLNMAKKNNKRIIAVGTTSLRVLETIYSKYNEFKSCNGNTNIFIYPPYKVKSIDCLITNFHLPKSTLIMLVSAIAGKDNILNAYKEAIKNKYYFFSFGDSMFINKRREESEN